MATATPHSFPGGVVADSSGVIDPSAPVSIRSQPVGGVLGSVVAYSTVMTLGVTDDTWPVKYSLSRLEPTSVTCASCYVLKGNTAFFPYRGAVITPNCGEAAAVQANPARIMAMLRAVHGTEGN